MLDGVRAAPESVPYPHDSRGARTKPKRDIQGTARGYSERRQGGAEFDKYSSELAGCTL